MVGPEDQRNICQYEWASSRWWRCMWRLRCHLPSFWDVCRGKIGIHLSLDPRWSGSMNKSCWDAQVAPQQDSVRTFFWTCFLQSQSAFCKKKELKKYIFLVISILCYPSSCKFHPLNSTIPILGFPLFCSIFFVLNEKRGWGACHCVWSFYIDLIVMSSWLVPMQGVPTYVCCGSQHCN